MSKEIAAQSIPARLNTRKMSLLKFTLSLRLFGTWMNYWRCFPLRIALKETIPLPKCVKIHPSLSNVLTNSIVVLKLEISELDRARMKSRGISDSYFSNLEAVYEYAQDIELFPEERVVAFCLQSKRIIETELQFLWCSVRPWLEQTRRRQQKLQSKQEQIYGSLHSMATEQSVYPLYPPGSMRIDEKFLASIINNSDEEDEFEELQNIPLQNSALEEEPDLRVNPESVPKSSQTGMDNPTGEMQGNVEASCTLLVHCMQGLESLLQLDSQRALELQKMDSSSFQPGVPRMMFREDRIIILRETGCVEAVLSLTELQVSRIIEGVLSNPQAKVHFDNLVSLLLACFLSPNDKRIFTDNW
jgi:hypothetical protein